MVSTDNKIKPDIPEIKVPVEKDGKFTDPDIGKIPQTIGRGEDAKNSFIYLTLKWSFISGCIITILVVANNWLFRQNEKVPDFVNDIELIWNIIVPVVTLALGYAFGKSRE